MLKLLFDPKDRNFLKLCLAQVISQFGDRIHQMSLVGLAAKWASGSTSTLANLIAFTIIPVFLIQPFAGVYVDRWDRKATFFICDLARAILVLLIAFVFINGESRIPVYAVVFLSFCFSRFHVPAKMSVIPDLVDNENLLKANSLFSMTGMIAFVLGASLGGFIVDWHGPRVGFMVDAATFLTSALLLVSLDLTRRLRPGPETLKKAREIIREAPRSVFFEIREGFSYLWSHRELRLVIDMLFALLAAAGSIYVVIIVFIQKSFNSVTKDLGMIAVCLGIGLFIGAMLHGKWGKIVAWHKMIFLSLISGGILLVVFTFLISRYPNRPMAMGLAAFLGIVIGPIFIAANTIAHVVSEPRMRGKVFSALEIVIHLAFLLAMMASSWATRFVPELWILCAVGGMIIVIGAIGLWKGDRFASFG
jgi:MFS family permease